MRYRLTLWEGRFLVLDEHGYVVFQSKSLAACEAWIDAQEDQ